MDWLKVAKALKESSDKCVELGNKCSKEEVFERAYYYGLNAVFSGFADALAKGLLEEHPDTSTAPMNCRNRLMKEGRPYLRSSCAICGPLVRENWKCPYER